MKNCEPGKIRNFVIAGASGSGKTALVDLMLFKAGAVARQGNVDNGSSLSDFRKEEQERKCSIYSSIFNCNWKDSHFFFIDTPGGNDSCGEAMNAINAADMMILVVDAATEIGPGTLRAWRQARDRHMPRLLFINGCDRDNADFFHKLDIVRQACIRKASVPYTLPIGMQGSFSGVNLVLGGGSGADIDEAKKQMMEAVADSDDLLMEKYLETDNLTDEELENGLRNAFLTEKLVPIFAGSVAKDIGVDELMDFVVKCAPTPLDELPLQLDEGEVVRNGGDAVGYVFKSVNDAFVGQLTYLRVYSGHFTKDSEIFNATKQSKERLGSLLLIQGKNQEPVDEAGPGELVAIAKLKNTGLLDVLTSHSTNIAFAPVVYPQPTTMYAISAAGKGEDDKLAAGLQRLLAEDHTLKVERNAETHQTILSGMGDIQIGLLTHRLKNDFKVQVNLETPRVPYRETVKGVGEESYRHKKQSGGHGQFAEVHMRIEPFAGTVEEEYQFGNEVVGGAIPKNFIPAIEKGVAETRMEGPLSHSKVINFKAVVFFGKYHPVDSSEMAFKIATRGAFRAAMAKAKPELLEPIMSLTIEFPDEYMGAVQGDLNSRRGRILGMDRIDAQQVVTAEVPLAEVYSYPAALRSMTQGRGFFTMKFERYDPVPAAIAKKIEEAAAKEDSQNDE